MKTKLTLIICLVLHIGCFAQKHTRQSTKYVAPQSDLTANERLTRATQTAQHPLLRNQNQTSKPGTEQRYFWQNNAWLHVATFAYTYDAAGNQTQTLATPANGIQPDLKITKTFTTDNKPLITEEQVWANNQWQNDYREVRTYDSHGNLVLEEEQEPVASGWETYFAERTTYTYNPEGHYTSYVIEQFENGAWTNWGKAEFVQQPTGEYSEATYYLWENNNWQPANKQANIVWHNFAKELRSSYNRSYWEAGTWVETERYHAAYSQNDSFTEIMKMKNQAGLWDSATFVQVAFDNHENLANIQVHIRQDSPWLFMFEENYALTYDAAGNLTESIEQYRQEDTAALENTVKHLYSDFTVITSAEKPVQETELSVWPNPVTSQLRVAATNQAPVTSVQLFDMTGRQLLHKQSANSSEMLTIDLAHLPSGIYLLRAHTGTGFSDQKIVKQ